MIVVDANILVYLVLEGDKTEQAKALRSKKPDWRSEAFILVEVSNVLATYVRAKKVPLANALKIQADAEKTIGTGLEVAPHDDVLRTAATYSISAYDARYLWVAKFLGVKLVTEDTKLRSAVPTLTMSLSQALEQT